MGERPTVQQVNADRKTNTALMMSRYASDKAPA
jgi:glutathione S-transferase